MLILENKDYLEERITKVKEGIKFILSHFEGRQPLFPRKISTLLSNGKQFTVYNENQILCECIKAKFTDCRINAYPILDPCEGVNKKVGINIQAPNVIFIDIDLPVICNDYQHELGKLRKILDETLRNIESRLDGCKSTVLWTGNGYHVYIVIDARPLELITELRQLSSNPSEEFLRFAEITFSANRKDSNHNPSFKSCLLRIPYTLNSKCMDYTASAQSNDPEVKIIQRFYANTISTIDSSLLREYRLYLADSDIRHTLEISRIKKNKGMYGKDSPFYSDSHIPRIPDEYQWIKESLLKTPIQDHRKYTTELVLAPYLVVIKHLLYDEACSIIKDWVLKCNALRPLDPSLNDFLDCRIVLAIEKSFQCGIPPMKMETMRNKYPQWYNDFRKWQLFS